MIFLVEKATFRNNLLDNPYYNQGEVLRLANSLRDSVDWSAAIKSSNEPQIFAQVDASTGELSGDIRPFNEYYLVAYLALITSGADSKVVFNS